MHLKILSSIYLDGGVRLAFGRGLCPRVSASSPTSRVGVSASTADELENVGAGRTLTWRFDLDRGDRLILDARMLDGARPAARVENPNGATIVDIGPSDRIQRTVDISQSGRHFIVFENEASLTSGQWDMRIEFERDYEEEICN